MTANADMVIERTSDAMPQETADLEAFCLSGLARARRAGAGQADIAIETKVRTEAGARDGEPETLTRSRTTDVVVTIHDAGRKGIGRAHGLSPTAIEQAIDKAIAVARYTQPDAANGLAEPQDDIAGALPDLGIWQPAEISAAELFVLAQRAETAGLAVDSRIRRCEGASASAAWRISVHANSNGFVGHAAATSYEVSASFIAHDDDGQQSGSNFDTVCDLNRLTAPGAIGEEAAKRAIERLAPRTISTRVCPILFTPEVAGRFWRNLIDVISGPAICAGNSFLAGQLGERIMPDFVQIDEQPHIRHALGSCHHDRDGLLKRASPIISDGRLVRYLLDSYAGRRLQLAGTRNAGGISNVVVASTGADSFAEMVARIDEGLIVSAIMGHGFDAASGDYSVGASGFWVERGEIVHAVDGVTIAARSQDMLAGILAIGNDQDVRGRIRTGSTLFGEMTVGG